MLRNYTNKNHIKLLATKTREDSCRGLALANYHREIGKLLGYSLLDDLVLEECYIKHPKGKNTGFVLSHTIQPTIMAVMRAGLFVAEGVWDVIPQSALVLQYPKQPIIDPILGSTNLLILVDSVINTGVTLESLLTSLTSEYPNIKYVVMSLVCYAETAEKLNKKYPQVDFYLSRISSHSYVGQGASDTGSRLFNTLRN